MADADDNINVAQMIANAAGASPKGNVPWLRNLMRSPRSPRQPRKRQNKGNGRVPFSSDPNSLGFQKLARALETRKKKAAEYKEYMASFNAYAKDQLRAPNSYVKEKLKGPENAKARRRANKELLGGSSLQNLLYAQRVPLPDRFFNQKRLKPQIAVQLWARENGITDPASCAAAVEAAARASRAKYTESLKHPRPLTRGAIAAIANAWEKKIEKVISDGKEPSPKMIEAAARLRERVAAQ